MTDFIVDKRDLEFCLFDQGGLDKFTAFEKYADFDRESLSMILDEVIKFSQQELRPTNGPADAQGCKVVNGQVYVPEVYIPLYKKFREAGWMAPSMNPEYGGMGLPMAMAIAAMELFIGASGSFVFFPGLTVAAGHLLESFASPELRDLLVPKLYTGEWTGTMCLTEPQAGSAVGDLRTTAEPIPGTNAYAIRGQKIFISAGDHNLAENIIHLVLARVPGDAAGTRGISLFMVPKHRFDAQGKITGPNDVTTAGIEHKMGIHGSPTCSLSFGDNGACEGYLVGEQSRGIVYMFQMMNEARITCGVQGAAAANASYQLALAYAKERVQGPKVTDRSPEPKSVPIIEHPDVRRNLLLAKSISEGIRALLLQTAIYADLAEHAASEDERTKYGDLVELLTPICKAYATDQGFRVTELAIQLHGGYGYIKEYGVEQYMRDTKIASLYEGTNGIQALDLLGRKMRMKGGGLFLTWLQETNTFLEGAKAVEPLADVIKAVDDAKNTVASTAFSFMQQGKGNMEAALLGATPFLEMFGHAEVGRLLLHQAVIAHAKLQELYAAQGATTPEARRELTLEHPEARFLDGKVKTARFFAVNQLPHVRALSKTIQTQDTSALDIVF